MRRRKPSKNWPASCPHDQHRAFSGFSSRTMPNSVHAILSTKPWFASQKLYLPLCFIGAAAVIAVVYLLCIQLYRRVNRSRANQQVVASVPEGIILATLLRYPKILYSRLIREKGKSGSSSPCSICLRDYRSSDLLRLLPECGHFYHVKCVDPWLRTHWSCPVCRNSMIPAPRITVSGMA